MFKYILLGFTIYFAYRFLFDFLIPVVRTTHQVKKQFDTVRKQQQDFEQKTQPKQQNQTSQHRQKPASDDYIEFEEV